MFVPRIRKRVVQLSIENAFGSVDFRRATFNNVFIVEGQITSMGAIRL
jgi:hypothetical protein